jgi:hypothetical protein
VGADCSLCDIAGYPTVDRPDAVDPARGHGASPGSYPRGRDRQDRWVSQGIDHSGHKARLFQDDLCGGDDSSRGYFARYWKRTSFNIRGKTNHRSISLTDGASGMSFLVISHFDLSNILEGIPYPWRSLVMIDYEYK